MNRTRSMPEIRQILPNSPAKGFPELRLSVRIDILAEQHDLPDAPSSRSFITSARLLPVFLVDSTPPDVRKQYSSRRNYCSRT